MALALAKLTPNADHVSGNKRVKVRTVTWTANYQTDAHDTFTAADVGLSHIDYVRCNGLAPASTPTTAVGVTFKRAADGQSVEALVYESGASGAALAEKTDNEAMPTGASVVVEIVGR